MIKLFTHWVTQSAASMNNSGGSKSEPALLFLLSLEIAFITSSREIGKSNESVFSISTDSVASEFPDKLFSTKVST